jgi:hypothetical protein
MSALTSYPQWYQKRRLDILIAESVGFITKTEEGPFGPRLVVTAGQLSDDYWERYKINRIQVCEIADPGTHTLPNFTEDLNAMAIVVRTLNNDKYEIYMRKLMEEMGAESTGKLDIRKLMECTGTPRAKSYLRTIELL